MRITHVSLYANEVEAISFSLRPGATDSKYSVRAILGIDADELIPMFYGFGLETRTRYYEFSMKPREIVIRVKLNPRGNLDESVSDLRDDIYRAVSASRAGRISLHFNSSGTTMAKIDGFITKVEAAHFNQLPEAQITVRCNDPMFRAVTPVSYDPAVFSSSNPVILGDSISTAPHGMNLQMLVTTALSTFTIQDVQTDPDWKFVITPSGGFLIDDVLYISSEFANKTVYLVRGGITIPLLDRIVPGSIWPVIFPGANEFWFSNLVGIDWQLIEYYPAFWGV